MLRSISSKTLVQQRNFMLLSPLGAKKSSKSGGTSTNQNVPGLSNKCVEVPNTPVGPGAAKDKEYKNPEYFCYHIESFGEAEVELAKYRLPAPSNKVPFNR
ncbi:NADH:ubiquinone oxidoreductase subunit V3 [Megachile rotundata]|uniref:NADH:ubiquinone oxidoreductase subunit V3 n=1 Tax=Megachile rotundata TaxID=143995 RepID=UPI000258EE23|nr:PREDICTED: uncharacterized protein LOC100874785 [Megachile rotundata]XP_012145307.1 PREDICTED: uncharacterized protein LOC100874785 [Megachile rotundata]